MTFTFLPGPDSSGGGNEKELLAPPLVIDACF
eukprot:CAMPEP_0197683266 /NCGR_PEP_ID=MMETSP1338-20131121/97675_1 /TAXON_ID=43686 ORGANISM="Pelagodinium beii, Strain RCC1491" /NCGR_SAMPLE_ID=MMETSP1338 /ASSEMBLY_ACC=CAM_ASM_000754 /LENGTH=31 /DNA_ID= /DNA_START= /DNA_END= /DNA_ORIENTATION=